MTFWVGFTVGALFVAVASSIRRKIEDLPSLEMLYGLPTDDELPEDYDVIGEAERIKDECRGE